MKYLSVIVALFALLLSFDAFAAGNETCDERCQFQKHSPGTGLKTPVPNEVCFRFVQDAPMFVTLTMYDAYDLANPARRHILRQLKHQQPDGTTGQFCVGPQWVKSSVFVDLCNDVNHSDRSPRYLQEGLNTGVVEQCLLGEDACKAYWATQH